MNASTYLLLKKMEKRTAMWTGEHTCKSIFIFISGYVKALEDFGIEHEIEIEIDFFDWVASKLGFYESTAGWANMILANVMGLDPKNMKWTDFDINVSKLQHQESVKIFYSLLDEYYSVKCKNNKA